MAELLRRMLAGGADGVFGYTTTHTAALSGIGQQADTILRFLAFRSHCPWLYGSALMVATRLMQTQPVAVRALVQCLRAGILAAQAAPEQAIDAVLARSPQLDRAVEMARWLGTLRGDMPGADGALVLSGDALDARLAAAIDHLGVAKAWPHRPAPQQVFTRAFL
jgi:NitT/TauT family transport system substrate-binding protein